MSMVGDPGVRICPECLRGDEDPAPWCDCRPDERCAGPCHWRAHAPDRCPWLTSWEPIPAHWSELERRDVLLVNGALVVVFDHGTHEGRRWLKTTPDGGLTMDGRWAPEFDPDPLVERLQPLAERLAVHRLRLGLGDVQVIGSMP